MDNKLTIWIHYKFCEDILNKIKNRIKRTYLLDGYGIRAVDNGVILFFNDESDGKIEILISRQKDTYNIQVAGEFDWEVVRVYQLIQALINDIVEGVTLDENHHI
ncbi:hypothetical protein EDM57_04470 [Brevibacillus gelatini]|uniref:Uncharacterized protein n=1 Tax=Brevibacillus gelatini TaxID=1655277 RepID=A0A3M8B7H3_9BACL|nr:hypothetical protein [Brevibacillus gelatini]RNB59401.1 hypothetical protein EDM57_04470 [Brevibacillus gelatini]